LTVSVTVAERADDPSRLADMVTQEENLIEQLGVLVIKLDRTLASALPWLSDPVGLVVAAQLKRAVGGLRSGDVAVFHVNRRGRRYYVAFVMD